MSRVAAIRTLLVLLVLIVAGLSGAIEAQGEDFTPPTVEVLSPATGAKMVVDSARNKWPTWRLRVTYPAGYTGPPIVGLETALDPAFTQNRSGSIQTCAAGVLVCELTFTTRKNLKPGTRVYWRVKVHDLIVVETRSFLTTQATGATASDRDRDGIPNAKDNCPTVSNRKQTDFEHDGKGDACQPDRKAPRVKAYSGWERRGQHAQFHWRAIDNRPVTIRLELRWRGKLMLRGWMPNVEARLWGGPAAQWESEKPIDSRFPIGTYSYCISAKDAAGHKATSCAPYQIKA